MTWIWVTAGLKALVVPFSHPGRLEVGASCMSPPLGSWDKTSMSPWVLPATPGPAALTLGAQGAAVGQAACWHHPNLAEAEKSCVGTATEPGANTVPGGDALVPLAGSLQHRGTDPSPAALVGCRHKGLTPARVGGSPDALVGLNLGGSLLSFRL